MQLECEHKENCQVEFKVVILKEMIKSRYEKELNTVLAKAELPGFRVGKVPRHVIASRFNRTIEQETIQKLISAACTEGIKEHNIQPVTVPSISNIQYKDLEELSFTALMEIKPRIEFEDYRHIPLVKKVVTVKEEDIESQLQSLQEEHATLADVEDDRPVMNGDIVLVDFEYTVDDKVERKENHLIEIGRDTALPEFDEKLIGLRVGEDTVFTIAVPEVFINPSIAGKDITFTVKIKELKEKHLPALDDDFAIEIGDYDTLDEVKDDIRKGLAAGNEAKAQEVLKDKLLESLLERCDFQLPKTLVEKETTSLCDEFVSYFESQKIQLPENETSKESLRQRFQPRAEKKLKSLLILEHIALKENITVSDEEYRNWIFTNFRVEPNMIREYLSDEEKKDMKMHEMLVDKILNFLIDAADIKVETVDQEEVEDEM